jgi:PAS domain S-box-containing protein
MRAALLAFGGAVVVLIAGLMANDISRERTRVMERAVADSQNLARALEHHTTQAIVVVDHALQDIRRMLSQNPDRFAFDPEVSRRLQDTLEQVPQVRRFLVLDALGQVVQDSEGNAGQPPSFADSSLFLSQRDYGSAGAHFSQPEQDPRTGRWSFGISRGMTAGDGTFAGAVIAQVEPAYFQRIYDALNVGRYGLIQLLRRDGATLVREPFDERIFLQSSSTMTPYRDLVQWRRDGTKTIALPPDRVRRVISYRSVPDRPLVVVVGLSVREVLAQWRSDAKHRIFIAVLITAAVILLTMLLLRNLARRDASEAALRDSEQRFELAVRGTSDGLWDWDIAAGVTWFAPRALEILGVASKNDPPLTEAVYQSLLHPDDIAQRNEAIRAHLEGGKPYDIEYRIRRGDGEWRWIRSRGEAIRDDKGTPIRMAGSLSDVHDHRAAETALVDALDNLRESEGRLSSLIANIPGVIYRDAYDEAWTEMFINEGIAQLTGYPATDFVIGGPRTYASIILPEDREGVARTVRAAVERRQPFTVEYRIHHRDGSQRWVWERGQAVYDPDGRVLHLDGCIFDISDRKQFESELRKAKDAAEAANEAKSQFLAHMSHELRTPLNAIIGFSEVMESEIFGPLGSRQYRDYAADIHRSGTHLLGVINDILDLSKIEAGHQDLHEEDCDIDDIVADALRLIADRAMTSGVELERQVQPNLPFLRADSRMVKQILLNLLSNAVKFTPAGGRIKLLADMQANDGIRFTVSDTGIGIPPDQIRRVLEPFVQVEGTFSRRYAGTGLGLPLSKAFAERHGAALEIHSSLGAGTTITVSFPQERSVRKASAA